MFIMGRLDLRVSLAVAALVAVGSGIAAEELFSARSRDEGAAFDLTIRETARQADTSVVNVPGFHDRTGAGSRWLMCKYNALAKRRGFRYWAVVYPSSPTESFPVAFYQSDTTDVAKVLGIDYDAERLFPNHPMSVEEWDGSFCGGR
jgi:hypothetical protein